jgi:hypothetical protein
MCHQEGHLTGPGGRGHGCLVISGVGNIGLRNLVAFVRRGKLWWWTSVLGSHSVNFSHLFEPDLGLRVC